MRSLLLLSVAVAALAVLATPASAKKPPQRSNAEGASKLTIVIDRAKMTATELFQSAKMVPYIHGKGKKLAGYLLSNVVPTTAFAILGFREGDVLKSVNGIVVQDPKSGVDLVQSLEASDKGEITFLREGKEQTVRYKKR